jgi:hypothetical protein
MKQFYLLLVTVSTLFTIPISKLSAQCPASYTQAQANWDNLEYYYNAGLNVAPYGYVSGGNQTYVSNAQEQTQRFAIGPNSFSIVTSAAGIVKGDNATHTGDIAGYTGHDAQFTPTANGQTITITFATPVRNANFTLYGIDQNAVIDVNAANAGAGALMVNAAAQGVTILTIAGGLNKTISDLTNTTIPDNDNRGTVTINVAGTNPNPVKTVTITCTTIGGNVNFWLSDIFACVTGSFPTNWHQGVHDRPFTGPTQNQPDYFIITPDNNSVYMIDPATAVARFLFTDAAKTYVNSFAYDAANRYLYYISENVSLDRTNKVLKRYDFNAATINVVLADISATLGFATFNAGVESAAAAFYNGQLYFGIEGGQYSAGNTRESMIWRIDFDASQNPVSACQVYSSNSYDGAGAIIHDWADILVKDGTVINYNSARAGANYTNSSYTHFDMMTGVATRYNNPSPGQKYSGQAGMSWAGTTYMAYDSLWIYNAGVISSKIRITTQIAPGEPASPAWVGNAGDGAESFRPKCDFGDAPATYDPNPVSPAVHERSELIYLGATWDKEWLKRGVTGNNDVDDGLGTVPFLQPGTSSYLAQVSLYNTGLVNATVQAWLDYNGNGVFDPAEAATIIPAGAITPGAGVQTRFLYWPGITTPLLAGASTYLRIRITEAAAGMTGNHSTGYFTNGEVEDYRVPVDNYPLATQLLEFKAALESNTVKINWKAAEDANVYSYDIEKSIDNTNWTKVSTVEASKSSGTFSYQTIDANPLKGVSYYRLRIAEGAGMSRFSAIRKIVYDEFTVSLSMAPNPARDKTSLVIEANEAGEAVIEIVNMQGKAVMSQKRKTTGGTNTVELLFPPALSSGVYMVKVTVGGKTVQQKLIIN